MTQTTTKSGNYVQICFQDHKFQLHGYWLDRDGKVNHGQWSPSGQWLKETESSMDLNLKEWNQ